MKERLLNLNLRNLTTVEVAETTAHLTAPASPSLLFADGTTVHVSKDAEGNLMLRVAEPETKR